jgi:hypothetical protein
MKKSGLVAIAISLMFFVSCGKPQTEAERNAEVERQVQQRLAAERQTAEQQQLAQREADLKARESALAEKEKEAAQTATPQMRATEIQQRDIAEAEQPPQRGGDNEPESYNTFYTKLEPYGAWRETSTYGYVWQPNESQRSRNWRPYTNGRWVYTDAGWTWNSEEPYGWATYHYGRWTRLRNVGWVWIPGEEWAPAWVSWRKSDAYVGWAPLPPEARFDHRTGIQNWADNSYDIGPEQYCFVATNDFGEEKIERTIVPVERNVTIVNQTTNVTSITYNNNVVVNQGPNYDELRLRTRQPIQRLRLERRARFQNGQDARPIVRGEVIEMSAPAIAARAVDRPRVVKEKIAQTVVDHNWGGKHDEPAAEKARAKMKAEATPPSGAPAKANIVQAQPQQTPVAPASATPVRNFPQRAKITPRPTATATPAAAPKTTATPSVQPKAIVVPNKSSVRDQKPKQPQKIKAAKNQPGPMAPPKPSPAPMAKKPIASPSAAPSVPGKPVAASPAKSVSPNEKKKSGEKAKNKNGPEKPSPSPSPSAQRP